MKRITVRRNNELVPTNTLILTFSTPTLPDSVKAGYLRIPVVPYIPNPLRCFKCQKFGHGQNTCRGRLTCARCGQFDHDSKTCQNEIACTNCSGKHSRECSRWKMETTVQQVKVERYHSLTEARTFVDTSLPAATGKTYAAMVKVSTTSVAIQTDLTWSNGEEKYKNIADIKKTNKQIAKADSKQISKASQVSLDSRNPPKGLSGEPGPSKPTTGKDTKQLSKDAYSGRLKKAEKQVVPTKNRYETLAEVDDLMDISQDRPQTQKSPKKKLPPYFPLMTNSVIQWNCRGLRPKFDELSILTVKHNPLAVCLQETFLKDTDNINVRGFNLYHKCQETENRASGGVSILVNENIPQSIVTLNTHLQAVNVKVTAHKTITLCSVYLPPRNHFNFNPKDLQSVIEQLPSPFILMGDFNGHHTLWGCEDVNNRGQQLEGLILKNDLILLNDKSHTYFHSASGTFTSIDLTLCI